MTACDAEPEACSADGGSAVFNGNGNNSPSAPGAQSVNGTVTTGCADYNYLCGGSGWPQSIQITPHVSVSTSVTGSYALASAYTKWASSHDSDDATYADLHRIDLIDGWNESNTETRAWTEFCFESHLCGDDAFGVFKNAATFFNTTNPGYGAVAANFEIGCGQSFTADTTVRMSDGSAKAISAIRTGDSVKATDTRTATTAAKRVTAVMVNHDSDLMDITVTGDVQTSTIHSTENHDFWDETRNQWVAAKNLVVGDRLRTDTGASVTVAQTVVVPGSGDMWDLTVDGDHDFYVVTPVAAVLVHNCNTGLVYLRIDQTGALKPYVGQSRTYRFLQRQNEHDAAYPDTDFVYEPLHENLGNDELDRYEQYEIDARGGPTNLSNPDGGLSNKTKPDE